jgi:hypothetical protein
MPFFIEEGQREDGHYELTVEFCNFLGQFKKRCLSKEDLRNIWPFTDIGYYFTLVFARSTQTTGPLEDTSASIRQVSISNIS